MKNIDITVSLTTRNRYNTTLPLCLISIANQTYPPKEVILVDDNEKKEFYDISIFKIILQIFKYKNIEFQYFHGPSKGQTYAQQVAFDHITTNWILKIDDDNILDNNVLEILTNTITEKTGAVSGLILNKKDSVREIEYESDFYNKIEDIYSYFNIQMCGNQDDKIKKVEHIYSNYLFRKDLVDGYPLEFAPAGHREDTVFTYQIYLKGYDLLINPKSITWHFNEFGGGNKQYNYESNTRNELKFLEKLKEWKIVPNKLTLKENSKGVYAVKNKTDYIVYEK
jgi:glycosyltransferase involved in cell wall biosynthesis